MSDDNYRARVMKFCDKLIYFLCEYLREDFEEHGLQLDSGDFARIVVSAYIGCIGIVGEPIEGKPSDETILGCLEQFSEIVECFVDVAKSEVGKGGGDE